MKKLLSFFTNPLILALIPSAVVCFMLPHYEQYLLQEESHKYLKENSYILYDDLNNDGESEKILAFDMDNGTGISVFNNQGIIDQWNFKGKMGSLNLKCLVITGDSDGNGSKEVYFFTLSADTILLHRISDYNNPYPSIINRFIATTGPGIKEPDPFIIPAEMDDLDNDGHKELIFGIGSGFSRYPRNVYAYNIKADTLLVSPPECSYFIYSIFQADINKDGIKEIIPYGYAAGNIKPEDARIHDHGSFLIVLNNKLDFIFDPVEFPGKYSHLVPFATQSSNETVIGCLYSPPSLEENSTLYLVNLKGHKTDSVNLNFHSIHLFTTEDKTGPVSGTFRHGTGIEVFKTRFVPEQTFPPHNTPANYQKDVDLDGQNEILVPNHEDGKLTIYRKGLVNPVSIDMIWSSGEPEYISLFTNNISPPSISVQTGQQQYLFRYRKNPAYPYYYTHYLIVYLGFLGFILLIKNIQKNQIRKKYETEKKISELQLALIRNQLDPHFTLNAINSVMYSINLSDREEASESLQKFAGLYRNLIISAGSTRRTILEEVEFCDDYLSLEKMRFGDKFNYTINIDEEVDKSALIPKMIIQIHAENSVKHGLAMLDRGGELNIEIRNEGSFLVIEISDNGIGRKKAAEMEKRSTGKGLLLMEELYSAYHKFYNQKIVSEITDLYDSNDKPKGTKVRISISRQHENTRSS